MTTTTSTSATKLPPLPQFPQMAKGVSATSAEMAAAAKADLNGFKFARLTPTGEKLMKAAHWWMENQRRYDMFPRERMCANNVSKVFSLVGLGKYREEGVRALLDEVKRLGAVSTKMPNTSKAFAAKLNEVFGGEIPAGTVVSGNNVSRADPGQQHVAFIGHTDENGVVWIYQNNWYRPENNGGQRAPFMVSKENLDKGYKRQWMATPWIQLQKDAAGKVVDVKSMLPAIDDMDPLNKEFFIDLAIPAEIATELGLKKPEKKPEPKTPTVKPDVVEVAAPKAPVVLNPPVVAPAPAVLDDAQKAQALVTGRPL